MRVINRRVGCRDGGVPVQRRPALVGLLESDPDVPGPRAAGERPLDARPRRRVRARLPLPRGHVHRRAVWPLRRLARVLVLRRGQRQRRAARTHPAQRLLHLVSRQSRTLPDQGPRIYKNYEIYKILRLIVRLSY